MPPEVFHCHPFVTPPIPIQPKSKQIRTLQKKYCQGRMKFTKRKLIPVLVFILVIASLIRLLKLTIITSSPSLPSAGSLLVRQQKCSSSSSICRNNISPSNADASVLTEKENRFLLDLVSRRIPCKILVFGLEPQYLSLASLNDGGLTVFIEDNPEKISTMKSLNKTRIYKVEYQTIAAEAFKLLKHARENPDCAPKFQLPKLSRCKLALTNLPEEVHNTKWDVVLVDGPQGDTPDSPGRMAAIYTASILARKGNVTDILVHDVDRMIEKWFSWEFLCEENLVSSKGRFWNFGILREPNATKFCTI
ncbi:glucuronoxylan 4-O-methyltransferase 1 [Olea europaea subsp. europaea]|uniref:Glucuronoxylan 4-O-methyltransferase 1 n=1 Tax=Olea europaea subsp. europaea TaxID=158383 RepID=A0A8S0U6N5_OLEEU|nr:glucuronoxylan 4-O-methyltransferase 1 [Olea europaea subsp. europaea]